MQKTKHPWHAQSAAAVLARLDSTEAGLNDEEASRRLERFGPNRGMPPRPVSAAAILLNQLRSVVVALLLAATAVSLVLGDPIDAAAIAVVLFVNTAIGFWTELRARRAMEGLLQVEVAWASVVRAGRPRTIAAEELVPGDVVELDAGQHVPADARLLRSTDLRTDEAALTGESLPVSKDAAATPAADTVLAERSSMVYQGTTVVAGTGRAVVTETGAATELGQIGALVAAMREERTPLERRLDALGRRLVWLALAVAALVAALEAGKGAGIGLVLGTGLALAVAAVPEALPAVATIALAVGLRRMARRRALVRRLPAVEALGSTTVLCTDKTRTLTSGEMSVVRVWAGEEGAEGRRAVLEAAALASRPREPGKLADPVDVAVLQAAEAEGIDRHALARGRPLLGLVPFSSERRLMAAFHEVDGGAVAYVKGAPAAVLDRSGLDESARRRLHAVNDALAGEGQRVLAVASGPVDSPVEASLRELTFLGFLGLMDPPAPGVKETIARLRGAGIRTVMLTGDQRRTAEAVARQVGTMGERGRVVDGRELEEATDVALAAGLADVSGFSRVSPGHKLRIVRAFQRGGDVVAMLGDGINDAAALKAADVGVAMGIRGTDVAKDAASIVLQDDRLETVASAVEEGRIVYDNIRKFVFYLFSCNVAEILVLLSSGLAGLPLPLSPLQILWLNLVTDTFPALALAVEPGEVDVMDRPPRPPQKALLSRSFLGSVLLHALLICGSTLAAFAWGLADGPSRANAMAFMTLALAQILHLGNARSLDPVLRRARAVANPFALLAVALSLALQVAAMYVGPLSRVLRVSALGLGDWAIVLGLSAVPAVAGQFWKLVRGRMLHLAVLGAVALAGGCVPLRVPGSDEIERATGNEAVVLGRVRTFDRGIEIDPWVVEPSELAAEDPIIRLALFAVESGRRRLYPPMGAGGRFAWILPAGTYLLYHTPSVEPPFNEPLAAFQVDAGPAPVDLGELDVLLSVDRPLSWELATYTLLSVRASPPTPEGAAWFLEGRAGTLPVRQGTFVVDPELHGLFAHWSRNACARILARHGLELRPGRDASTQGR